MKKYPDTLGSTRQKILNYCCDHQLNLKEVSEQYGITKGLSESVLAAKFEMLKKDYGA